MLDATFRRHVEKGAEIMAKSQVDYVSEYAEILLDKHDKGRLEDEKFVRLMKKLSDWAEYGERRKAATK